MERGRIPNPAMKPEHEALEAADARVYCTKEASSIQTLCRGVFCQQEHRRRRCQLTGSVQPYGSKPESPGVLRASLPRKLLLHLPKHRMALAENVQAAIRAKNSAARGVVMARLAARKWIRIRLVGAERALDQILQAWGMPDVCFQYVSSDIGSGRAIQIGGTTIVHCELHHVTCIHVRCTYIEFDVFGCFKCEHAKPIIPQADSYQPAPRARSAPGQDQIKRQ